MRTGCAGGQIDPERLLRHFQALLYTACKLNGDRTEAEDVIQETYLKAYRALAQLKRPDQCKAWLLRILQNTWTNWKVRSNCTGSVENPSRPDR